MQTQNLANYSRWGLTKLLHKGKTVYFVLSEKFHFIMQSILLALMTTSLHSFSHFKFILILLYSSKSSAQMTPHLCAAAAAKFIFVNVHWKWYFIHFERRVINNNTMKYRHHLLTGSSHITWATMLFSIFFPYFICKTNYRCWLICCCVLGLYHQLCDADLPQTSW